MSRCYGCNLGFKSARDKKEVPTAARLRDPSIPLGAVCHEHCKGPLRRAASERSKSAPVSAGSRSRGPPPPPPKPSAGGWASAGLGADAVAAMLTTPRERKGTPRERPSPVQQARAEPLLPSPDGAAAAGATAASLMPPPPSRAKDRQPAEKLRPPPAALEAEVLPATHERGGIAMALKWAARREATGAAAKPPPLNAAERVAVGSACAWHWLTEAEAKERGAAESKARAVLQIARQRLAERLEKAQTKLQDVTAELDALRAAKSAEAKQAVANAKYKGVPLETFVKAREICLKAGLNDIAGNFAVALVSGKLHVESPCASWESDTSRNILQANAVSNRWSERSRTVLIAMYSAPRCAARSPVPARAPPRSSGRAHVQITSPSLTAPPIPTAVSAATGIDYFNGSNSDAKTRGVPMPAASVMVAWRKRIVNKGAANPNTGFREANARRFLNECSVLVDGRPEPLKISWDFSDCGGWLRYQRNGKFVNDADMSEFDPSSESPKVLEALYLKCVPASRPPSI